MYILTFKHKENDLLFGSIGAFETLEEVIQKINAKE
jgi:hypothetical protein